MKLSLDSSLKRLARLFRRHRDEDRQVAARVENGTPAALGPERRQLTVMFCDLVDSTQLLDRFDDEDYWNIVETYFACCREHIKRYHGDVQRYEGDGLLAYFGYPQADEHAAQGAVLAALRIAATVPQIPVEGGFKLQTRIGIATGEVVVGKSVDEGKARENSAQGRAPNLAARILKAAPPGAVVVSETTHVMVSSLFKFDDLGPQTFKGFDEPVRVWMVTGKLEVESHSEAIHLAEKLTPLIGRENELTKLQGSWYQAKNGKGQVALICGEAGIGKSRVIRALLERLRRERFTLLHYYGVQYFRHSPLYPVAKQLEREARIREDDAADARLAKLEQLLAESSAGEDVSKYMPWFASLLSIPSRTSELTSDVSPERQYQETLKALVDRILAISSRDPVVVVFEDLHWMDETTLLFINQLISQAPPRRMLVLLSHRPHFDPGFSQPNLNRIVLEKLDRKERASLVMELTNRKALPDAVLEHIVDETDGIPLFVEEFTKSVLESGMLEERANAYSLVGDLAAMKLPHSLRDSLMARLDGLAPDPQTAKQCKEIAQTCAVIGRQFSYELVAAVSPHSGEALQNALQQLEKAELIFQHRPLSDRTYSFKHALVQEEAYQSILHKTLRRLHVRIAEVLERQFPAIAENEPELLAHHYTEGGQPLEAIAYWQAAATRAGRRAAHAQAIAHLQTSLRLLERLPRDATRDSLELQSQALLGLSLASTRGYAVPEVAAAYQRARTLCDGLDTAAEERFPVLRSGLVTYYVVCADYDTANDLSEQFVQKAEGAYQRQRNGAAKITSYHIDSYRCLGISRLFKADLEASRTALERCAQLYNDSKADNLAFLTPENPAVAALSVLPLTLWLLGYPDEALKRKREALELATELAHPYNIVFVHVWSAAFHQWRRESEQAAEHARAAMEHSQKYGFYAWLATGSLHLSIALGAQQRTDEAVKMFAQALPAIEASGAICFTSYFYSGLADAYGAAKHWDEAFARNAHALEIAERYRERFYHAELFRQRGALRLAQSSDRTAEAEADLKRAIALAREQRARSLELRALVSLHRLHRELGRGDESRGDLERSFGAFTEGFDTADLRDAAALLSV